MDQEGKKVLIFPKQSNDINNISSLLILLVHQELISINVLSWVKHFNEEDFTETK